MEYNIIYSNRKTLAIYINKDGKIEIRCNKFTPKDVIENMLARKRNWIIAKQMQIMSAKIDKIALTQEIIIELTKKRVNLSRIEWIFIAKL